MLTNLGRVVCYELSHHVAMKWLTAIGPSNVELLKDIRVRFPTTLEDAADGRLRDLYPATRFIEHAARNAISLPQGCVRGFNLDWTFENNIPEDSPCVEWKEVCEDEMVYEDQFDFISVNAGSADPEYVEGRSEQCSHGLAVEFAD